MKSELNVSSLKLEKEKEDFLYFAFRTNEKNNLMLLYKYITIMNKIYNLNSQNEVKPAFRDKSFHLYNEKILSKKNEYTKTYSYNVHSHSIKIFDNQYDFPVIDDSEMVRYRPWNIKGEYYDFLIELKKQEHFNLIEIKSDSFWKIFFWLFGSIAAIIDIIIPLFKSLWQKGRLCKKNRGSNDMNLNLTKNEIVQQNENIELPEINNNN